MTIQAITTPAGWIVEGECVCVPYWPVGHPDHLCACNPKPPPSELTDAIGKPCGRCRGIVCRACGKPILGRWAFGSHRGGWEHADAQSTGIVTECESGPASCTACTVDGKPTGLASVELVVPCLDDRHEPHPVTVRVFPDKVPVPIYGQTGRNDRSPTSLVFINEIGNAYLYDPAESINIPIDIGPNPAQHIGSFLVTGSVVDS